MKLTVYNKELDVVGSPSKDLPEAMVNKFIHVLMRSMDAPKHKVHAEDMAATNPAWKEDDDIDFAIFEYEEDDLHRYIEYAAVKHGDRVTYAWLQAMLEKSFNAWPFRSYRRHYVNNTDDLSIEARNFFIIYKNSDQWKRGAGIDPAHRDLVGRHFHSWISDALVNSSKNPGFLVKLRIAEFELMSEIRNQLTLYNKVRAPMFKLLQLEVHTIFDPTDPYHVYHYTNFKP